MRALALAVVLSLCAPIAADSPPAQLSDVDRRSLIAELIERGAEDQRVRSFDFASLSDDERSAAFAEWSKVDAENTARLKEIVNEYGWPTVSLVGEEASAAAFLIVQHADEDPAFQAHCLPMLEAAAERGEVKPQHVAYLTDRVRVKQRRPQVYGTQYLLVEDEAGNIIADNNGQVTYLTPVVEDVDNLDDLRAMMGLGPWANYEAQMAPQQGRTPAQQPRQWDGVLPVRSVAPEPAGM